MIRKFCVCFIHRRSLLPHWNQNIDKETEMWSIKGGKELKRRKNGKGMLCTHVSIPFFIWDHMLAVIYIQVLLTISIRLSHYPIRLSNSIAVLKSNLFSPHRSVFLGPISFQLNWLRGVSHVFLLARPWKTTGLLWGKLHQRTTEHPKKVVQSVVRCALMASLVCSLDFRVSKRHFFGYKSRMKIMTNGLHSFASICIHLKGSWRIELNGLIRVHKIWFILPWPWTSCTSAQEPSDHPGVPESLAFDIFWPLKVSEGQGAKFAEFLLRAFEFQELNLNFKEIDRESKFRWISYFSMKSC